MQDSYTIFFKYMLYIIYIYIYVNQYRTKSGQFEAGDQQTAQRTRLKVAEEKQRQEKEVTGRDDGLTGWNKCLGVRSLPLLKSGVFVIFSQNIEFYQVSEQNIPTNPKVFIQIPQVICQNGGAFEDTL